MVGTKFYKGEIDETLFTQCVEWCNNGNSAYIEDKGEYLECVAIKPYVPTIEDVKQNLISAVQNHMDEIVQTRGYDSIASACSYANDFEPNAKFKAEGQACVLWRSSVWSYCYEQLALFEAGKREVPTAEELIAELPGLNW